MDKQHLKGQYSMEFMILAAYLLFMFILVWGVISVKTTETNDERDLILGEAYVTKIQKEINLAATVLDGYHSEFILPQKIGSEEYNISVQGNEVIIKTKKQEFSRVIPSIIGNFTKGKNFINKTEEYIYVS